MTKTVFEIRRCPLPPEGPIVASRCRLGCGEWTRKEFSRWETTCRWLDEGAFVLFLPVGSASYEKYTARYVLSVSPVRHCPHPPTPGPLPTVFSYHPSGSRRRLR